MTPLARSIKHFKDMGWLVAKTETWNPFAKRRIDLFNFADAVAVNSEQCILIQATSTANISSRVNKIRNIQAAQIWLESPTRRILVHGWSKKGPRGRRKVWTLKEVEITTHIIA